MSFRPRNLDLAADDLARDRRVRGDELVRTWPPTDTRIEPANGQLEHRERYRGRGTAHGPGKDHDVLRQTGQRRAVVQPEPHGDLDPAGAGPVVTFPVPR